MASNWGEQVVERDLVADPFPHLTLDAFADADVLDEFLARRHGRDWRANV